MKLVNELKFHVRIPFCSFWRFVSFKIEFHRLQFNLTQPPVEVA